MTDDGPNGEMNLAPDKSRNPVQPSLVPTHLQNHTDPPWQTFIMFVISHLDRQQRERERWTVVFTKPTDFAFHNVVLVL